MKKITNNIYEPVMQNTYEPSKSTYKGGLPIWPLSKLVKSLFSKEYEVAQIS